VKAHEKLLSDGKLPRADELDEGGLRKIGLALVQLAADALIDAKDDDAKVSEVMLKLARALARIAERNVRLASGLVTRLPIDGPPWSIDRLRRLAHEEKNRDAVFLVESLTATPEAMLRANEIAGL